jgi:hypothetical protein
MLDPLLCYFTPNLNAIIVNIKEPKMSCPILSSGYFSSPDGVKGKLPSNTKIRFRFIAQGPNPSGLSPDMPAECQRKLIRMRWIFYANNKQIFPIPGRNVKGTYGYWTLNTPTKGIVTAECIIVQPDSDSSIHVTKNWPIR